MSSRKTCGPSATARLLVDLVSMLLMHPSTLRATGCCCSCSAHFKGSLIRHTMGCSCSTGLTRVAIFHHYHNLLGSSHPVPCGSSTSTHAKQDHSKQRLLTRKSVHGDLISDCLLLCHRCLRFCPGCSGPVHSYRADHFCAGPVVEILVVALVCALHQWAAILFAWLIPPALLGWGH